jgi:hypothetical protein
MSQHLSAMTRRGSTRLVITGTLVFAIVCVVIFLSNRPGSKSRVAVGERKVASENSVSPKPPTQVAGATGHEYLQATSDGQSLMQAVTDARFGLKPEETDPISGKSGPGYLGMSHDQNLNAWFDGTGATIRPTRAKEQKQKWQLGLRLTAYGYGSEMRAAPPIVAHHVKGPRIEYLRRNFDLRNANFELMKSDLSFISQSAIRNPQFIEWYENRSEGIEQGFKINERPARSRELATDVPLRLTLGITGGLRATVDDGGKTIKLADAWGKTALSYSQLTAVDANNQQLAARMEVSNDGRDRVGSSGSECSISDCD